MSVDDVVGEGQLDLRSEKSVVLLLKTGCGECAELAKRRRVFAELWAGEATLLAWLDGKSGRWVVSHANASEEIGRSVEFAGSSDSMYLDMPSAIMIEGGVIRKVISRDELFGRVRHAVRSNARD